MRYIMISTYMAISYETRKPGPQSVSQEQVALRGDLLNQLGISEKRNKITRKSPLVIVSADSPVVDSFPHVDATTLNRDPLLLQAELSEVPTVAIAPFYPVKTFLSEEGQFIQTEVWRRPQLDREGNFDPTVLPLYGFKLATKADNNIFLTGHEKRAGNFVTPVGIFDHQFRDAYHGEPTDEHRLWQYVVVGTGASKLWEAGGLTPTAVVLNGSETALAALQTLDRLAGKASPAEAVQQIRAQFIYLPSREDSFNNNRFPKELVDKYILPNLENGNVIAGINQLTQRDNGLHMPTLAQSLATTVYR
jgi:hypothetical protein